MGDAWRAHDSTHYGRLACEGSCCWLKEDMKGHASSLPLVGFADLTSSVSTSARDHLQVVVFVNCRSPWDLSGSSTAVVTKRLCSSNPRCKGAECDTAPALRWYRNRCLRNVLSVEMVVADLCFKTAIFHGKAWPVEVHSRFGMIIDVSKKACEFSSSARA